MRRGEETRSAGWLDLYETHVGVHASPETSIDELIARLATQAPLEIHLDPAVQPASARPVNHTLDHERLRLDAALGIVAMCLRKQGAGPVSWCVVDGKVLFACGLDCPEKLVIRIHTTAALTTGLDPPNDVVLVSPDEVSDDDAPLFGGEADVPTIEELRTLVQKRIEPDFWRTHPSAVIRCSGDHALVVTAPAAIHDEIQALLDEVLHREDEAAVEER